MSEELPVEQPRVLWEPDTCFCEVDLTNNTFTRRCKAHSVATSDEIKTHNKTFNTTATAKANERSRIAQL